MAHSLSRLIAETRELRSLPAITGRVLELLQDPTVGAAEVLPVIEVDPALTANLMKLANSAFFGVGRQIGSVHEALVQLGNRTVLSLAFAASMGRVIAGPLAAYRLDNTGLWTHSLATALGAAHLVSLSMDGRRLREQAFTAGLVHDIGKLLLNRPLKELLEPLPPDADSGAMLAAEQDRLGFDHAQAGQALAEAWNFPPGLAAVIGCHHDPEASTGEWEAGLLRAVTAADQLAGFSGYGGGSMPLPEEEFWADIARLEFEKEIIESYLVRLPGEMDALLLMLGKAN